MHSSLIIFTLVLNSALLFFEIVGFQLPGWCIRDFALFNIFSSRKNCPSARCASVVYVVGREVDVFGAKNVLHIL
jgi:uncharacterized membrane protein